MKVSLLAGTGIVCIMLDFTLDLACLSAKQFMAILKQDYRVQVLVTIGYDHRFGHNRVKDLKIMCVMDRSWEL